MIPIFFEITFVENQLVYHVQWVVHMPLDVIVLERIWARPEDVKTKRQRISKQSLSLLVEYWLTASHIPLRRIVSRLTASSSTIMDLAQEVILSLVRPQQLYQRLFPGCLSTEAAKKLSLAQTSIHGTGRTSTRKIASTVFSQLIILHGRYTAHANSEHGSKPWPHSCPISPHPELMSAFQGCMNAHPSFEISCGSTSASTLQICWFGLWVFLIWYLGPCC